LSGNRLIQSFLEKRVKFCQNLMGIGSASSASSSGEFSVFKLLKTKLEEPFCIFDVGANKGQFLGLALDKLGDRDFSIHCFEPSKETFSKLLSSCEDNRVVKNNFGMGKKKEEAVLHYDESGSGLASLTKRDLLHFGIEFDKSETVKINTIDIYCAENNIERIDLLKMDVEGHELDVLQGALDVFKEKTISAVMFEFGGCNIDTRTFFKDFWDFFSSRNYKLFRITPSGYLLPITNYSERYEQFVTTNYLALK